MQLPLMGNHEYNALCFNFKSKEGGYLREHNEKNKFQHHQTIEQFRYFKSEYEDYIEWFKSLPLFYETGKIQSRSCLLGF